VLWNNQRGTGLKAYTLETEQRKRDDNVKKHRFILLLSAGLFLVLIAGHTNLAFGAGEGKDTATKKVNEDLVFVKVLANPSAFKGEIVVWGGVIMKTVGSARQSALFLHETPFDFRGRPRGEKFSEGLFIAKTSEFLDPNIYTSGRVVTVAGEIVGQELGTYRDVPYAYPVIRIREVHLWKKESPPIQWNWGRTQYYWPDEYNPGAEGRQRLP
jgi:outer membrane lipoprotein